MFRIKTDIRQYKCETKEKVEKLIRNWVIRPNDLIYDQDDNTWEPIGEHPSFIGVFDVLAETEANTPDTVVSREPVQNNEENEVTNIARRPQKDEEDARETDVFDQQEIARSLAEKDANGTPAPPEAPEGVEPVPQNDEVTMMTDKTFDMLAEEADAIAAAPTNGTEDVEESDDDDAVPEIDETPDESEEEDNEDLTITNGKNGAALIEESDPTIVEAQEMEAPKLGRHNLPEEFFATNEISTVDRENVEKRDDLNSPVETSEVDDEWESMVEDDEEDDELRTTDELDPVEIKTSLKEKDEREGESDLSEISEAADGIALRDTDELERPPANLEEISDLDSDERERDEFDEDDEDSEVAEIGKEPSEPVHINGYTIPSPFPIGPNPDDIKVGLRRTRVARSKQLKAFPDPLQKEYKVPEIRNFDRTPEPPKDYTYLLVIALIGVVFLFILGLSLC